MFFRSLLAAFALLLLNVAPAHAVSAPTDFFYDMADYPEQSVTESLGGANMYTFNVFGSLDARSQIVFSYAFGNAETGTPGLPFMLNSGVDSSWVQTLAFTEAGNSMTASSVDGLIFAAASLPSDGLSGTAILRNFSNEAIKVSSLIFSSFQDNGSYHVTWTVSEVPLPAALPLFGLGLASLAGFSANRRRKA